MTRSGLTVSDTDSKPFKKLLGMSRISSEQMQWKKGRKGKKNASLERDACNPANSQRGAPIASPVRRADTYFPHPAHPSRPLSF